MAATRIPYMRNTISGQYAQRLKKLHNQYGEVVRVAPDELSFIDSDAWKTMYGTRTGHGQKQKDYRFYPPTVSNGASIIQSNDQDHSRFRRLLSHAFSDSSLRSQEPIIKGYVDLLIQRLRENSTPEGENAQAGQSKTKPLNLVAWYNFATFDIIGDLAFGEPFDCLKNSAYHVWVKIIFSSAKFGAYANISRRLPGSKYLVKLITPKRVFAQKEWHNQLSREKVVGRLEKSNERPDFFANILKHSGTEKGFSVDEMVSNGSTLIIAGSETTATLLSGVTYLLLKNPRVLAKLQDEIRSTFNSDEEINFDSCNRLEYCLAVLTEALRVYPPVPGGLPRIVDAQGDMIEGHWVPGGVSDFLALGEETCSYWRSAWQVTIFANLRYLL
jgi:cytochrome P450